MNSSLMAPVPYRLSTALGWGRERCDIKSNLKLGIIIWDSTF